VPDYQALLSETGMLSVLSHLRTRRATGALFVHGSTSDVRKEIYLSAGKFHHVASSDRNELLGEYLVRRGRMTREDLDIALAELDAHGGQLGDTLVGLGLVGALDVFRAIRDQGRDRVAALCGWSEGRASFYQDAPMPPVSFPLDLDIAHAMMAGVVIMSDGDPRARLPAGATGVLPGPRQPRPDDPAETESAPGAMRALSTLLPEGLTVETMILRLTLEPVGREGRALGRREACAALAAAHELGWVGWK
jgi:serine/threonine-protein kinase